MSTRYLQYLSILLLAAGTACVSASSAGGPPKAPRGDSRVLTADQFSDVVGYNAYDAIRSLRPAWLQKRGTQSIHFEGDVVVYLDRVRLGGPEALRSLSVTGIARMEFLDAGTATQRWGTGHTHGAILIISRS